jgi:hypothetical protein
MSDQDREAMLDAWNHTKPIGWKNSDYRQFSAGWQAARDHYAPKLTEKEAIDLIQKAMFEEKHTRGYSGTAIDALKAAGVRFKEEL